MTSLIIWLIGVWFTTAFKYEQGSGYGKPIIEVLLGTLVTVFIWPFELGSEIRIRMNGK